MSLKKCLIKTLWGCPEFNSKKNWPSLFKRIKKDGFDGVETAAYWIAPEDRAYFKQVLEENELKFVSQCHTAGYPGRTDSTFNNQSIVGSEDLKVHVDSLRSQMNDSIECGAIFCNSHSGHDSWGVDTCVAFLEEANKLEKEFNLQVAHETHRRRIFWNPFYTKEILTKVPSAKLTADLSHW